MKKLYLTILIVFITSGNFAQTVGWIEENYADCLTKKLPCECMRGSTNGIIYYNTTDTVFFGQEKIIDYLKIDSITFKIMDQTKYIHDGANYITNHISIKGDTLRITNLETETSLKYFRIKNHIDFEDKISLEYLTDLLNNNSYPDLYFILKSDTLHCDCDIQFGINRVHDNKNVWTLERKNESTLILYKWKYPKEWGEKAKKRRYKKFRLKEFSL